MTKLNNKFIKALEHIPTSSTENGALAYNNTYSSLLNYFSNCNNFHRSYEEVELDLNKCWSEDKNLTLKLIGYIRAISRTNNINNLPVRGLGLKKEGRLCLRWLYLNHTKVFYNNLETYLHLGSFQDIWHRDLKDWMVNKDITICQFIIQSLLSDNNQINNLSLKYLPRHKSISNIKRRKPGKETLEFHLLRNKMLQTICNLLHLESGLSLTIRDLMKWKTEGKSHGWQQYISNKQFDQINFDKLPGKVLKWITKEDEENESFLSRHNLEDKYISWLNSKDKLNNTSYLYELIKPAVEAYSDYTPKSLSKIQKHTIEKQIASILSISLETKLNVMPVLDTSGSMNSPVHKNISALDICLSLGIYFSMINKGYFKDYVIAFDTYSKLIKLSGSYLDRLQDLCSRPDFMGSTNFQSVINLIIKVRKENPNIPVEDYPDVYLVISDLQFNEVSNNLNNWDEYVTPSFTNHQEALSKFDKVGLPRPLFIWYNVSSYGNDNFQNHKNDAGIINMSGFDPSAINKLLSEDFQFEFEQRHDKSIKDITPYEAMLETLNQPCFNNLYV